MLVDILLCVLFIYSLIACTNENVRG